MLGLEVHASAEDYLARRRELGKEASRLLVAAAGIETFLIDTGIDDERLCSPADVADMGGGTAYEVVRLEALAEDLLQNESPRTSAATVEWALDESTAVAAKSIAAYRVGLDLLSQPPSTDALVAALSDLRPSGRPPPDRRPRDQRLARLECDRGRPAVADPCWLRRRRSRSAACRPATADPFLRATEKRGTPVLLLHNYPFHRPAAYLAQVFGHVFIDVGLAVHNAGALSLALIRETLELVPFGKLLFSSDAYGLAEPTTSAR